MLLHRPQRFGSYSPANCEPGARSVVHVAGPAILSTSSQFAY
jgi:hypothetical protein